MKTTFLRCLVPVGLLLTATQANATLDRAIVPADSQWVVHVDFAALRQTAFGQKLSEQLPKFELPQGHDAVRPNLPKIMETIGTATAFGRNLSGKPEELDGTLVLQGTADLRKIAEGAMAQMSLTKPEDVKELTDTPIETYLVSNQVYIAFPPEPIVLVSKSREQLLQSLEVFRGRGTSLARAGGPLDKLLPREESLYLMGATLVPTAQHLVSGNGPEARILQMARAGSVAVGESGDRAVARVQLDAASADVAVKLVKIVEGITAMVSLAETDDERLKEFVNALRVQRADQFVSISFSYPTDRLLQMVEQVRTQPASASPAERPAVEGTLLAEWRADLVLGGGDVPHDRNFTTRTIEQVSLTNGAIIVLTGHRRGGEHARWDYIELTPVAGGAAQRFEAEYMRLAGYTIEARPNASGGEMIRAEQHGTARLRFTGATGDYRLTVRYVDEEDGQADFAISVLPPEPAS